MCHDVDPDDRAVWRGIWIGLLLGIAWWGAVFLLGFWWLTR